MGTSLESLLWGEPEGPTSGDEPVVLTLFHEGARLSGQGKIDAALACYAGCERVARLNSMHQVAVESLERRAWLFVQAQRYDEAERAAQEGLHYARGLEIPELEVVFLSLLVLVLQRQEKRDEAIGRVFEGMELAQRTGLVLAELAFVADLAAVSLGAGDAQGALRQAQAGLARAELVGQPRARAVFLGILAEAYSTLGRQDDARRCAERGLGALPALPALPASF